MQRVRVFAVVLASLGPACLPSADRAHCARFDDDEAGCLREVMRCGFEPSRQCVDVPDAPERCPDTCVVTAAGCRPRPWDCQAIFPEGDGKRTHGNADIIGCRSVDGVDRCVLVVEDGAKLCRPRPGMEPCRYFRPSPKGECRARGRSWFG